MTGYHVSGARGAVAPLPRQHDPLDKIDIADLKRRNPIEVVVASYGVKLVQRGQLLVALCPFHQERTPSFKIHPGAGRWRCFGRCSLDGRWRDVIDFVGMMTYGPAWDARNRDMFRAAVARLDAGMWAASPAHAASRTKPSRVTGSVIALAGVAMSCWTLSSRSAFRSRLHARCGCSMRRTATASSCAAGS